MAIIATLSPVPHLILLLCIQKVNIHFVPVIVLDVGEIFPAILELLFF